MLNKPDFKLQKWSDPVAIYEYRDMDGELIYCMARYEADGEKFFQPFTPFNENGTVIWKRRAPKTPRPLYGLELLSTKSDVDILIAEGEKACEAARKLFPDLVVMTSSNGSSAAKSADWSALKNRRVMIWPDADEAGEKYAQTVQSELFKVGVKDVAILSIPDQFELGWDAADLLAEGWTEKDAELFIADAIFELAPPIEKLSAVESSSVGSKSQKSSKRLPDDLNQKQTLLALTEEIELFHDQAKEVYTTVENGNHYETMALKGSGFRQWLQYRYYEETHNAVTTQTMSEVISTLQAKAIHRGNQQKVYMRSAKVGDDIYLDLGTAEWQQICITADGWHLTHNPKVKFIRTSNMTALPIPVRGGSLDELYPFINVYCERDFRLLLAWMIAALRPEGESPYPLMILQGEQGTGKSILTRILRQFTDPNETLPRAMPHNEKDIIIAARNNHILAFDNLSGLSSRLSDCLCRLATGGGFGTRTLYTDMEETTINVTRPIILNGIDEIAARPDLAERAIVLNLPQVPEEKRQDERSMFTRLKQAEGRIFGAILDAIVLGLRNLPNVNLEKKPRMADFAQWATAAEQALGWEQGGFMQAYQANQQAVIESSIESQPLITAMLEMLRDRGEFEGLVKELYSALETYRPEWEVGKYSRWPNGAPKLGKDLKRFSPVFRKLGIKIIELPRTREGKPYQISFDSKYPTLPTPLASN